MDEYTRENAKRRILAILKQKQHEDSFDAAMANLKRWMHNDAMGAAGLEVTGGIMSNSYIEELEIERELHAQATAAGTFFFEPSGDVGSEVCIQTPREQRT
jgi:hypothetical protein